MSIIIGGHDTGLFDSSLFLLNRGDRTHEGMAGHGEDLYVNVANGNLVVMHRDAYLPSQGDDFVMLRTYNSRGRWGGADGQGWSNSMLVVELSDIDHGEITLISPDASRTRFTLDRATGRYISVDGAGAYEVITYDRRSDTYSLTRSNQTVLVFDDRGTLLSSRDTNGNRIQYVYEHGRLKQVKDDEGHVIHYIYSGGDLVRVKDELGTVLVEYDYSHGKLVAVTDRAGHTTRYAYHDNGALKSISLPSDGRTAERVLRFEYGHEHPDVHGGAPVLRWLIDAEGNRTYFDYDFERDRYGNYDGGSTVMVTALGINRRESNAAEYVQWRVENGYYALWDPDRMHHSWYRAQAEAIAERHSVRYSYDRNGAITSVVDQAGYKTAYEYDEKENLTAVIDANGFAITRSDDAYWRDLRREYGYVDAAGQGRSVDDLTHAEIRELLNRYTARFEYDSRGNQVRRTDNEGNVTEFTYTDFNKLATQTSAMGHALAFSDQAFAQDRREALGYPRSAAALTAEQRAALKALHTTTYTYDARQNLVELRSPGGDLTRYEYDSFGNLVKRIIFLDAADLANPDKQQVTQYFYDAFGQNIRTVDAEGHTTRNSFDHFGNLLTHTDGRGGVTRYTYDKDNRVLTATDPEGHVTVNTYDAVGNRIALRDASGHSVLYVYDRNNMLVSSTDPQDGPPSGDRVTRFGYDVTGNRTSVRDAQGRVTVYVYREDNRLLEVRAPRVANAAGTGSADYVARYAYDGTGNRITVTDFNGNRSQYVYDRNGLLKRGTDATGNVTEYRYDANLNQIQIIVGAQLAAERRRVLRFSFDEEDQRVAETDAEGGTTRYSRDATGNVVAVTDANGHTSEFRFDRNNRLVTEIRAAVDGADGSPVQHTVQHQYDANGNRVAVTDENGHVTRFSFDRDDRLVLVEDANGIQTAYGYDSRHNRTSIAVGVQAHLDSHGRVVIDSAADARVETVDYNEFNEVVSRTDGVGNALVTSDSALYQAMRQQMGYAALAGDLSYWDRKEILAAYTDRFTYDKVGNMLSVTDHLGRTTRMSYDALNRQVQSIDALGQVWRQRYDGNGNRVAVVDALGREQRFAYDGMNRLVSQTDALGVVTTQGWDHVGNLVETTQAAGTADARTQRFEYDLNNRLTRSIDALGASQAYEYDAVGNRLRVVDRRGNATGYVYDARNRMVRTIDPLGFETRVEYDGVGNRLALLDARGGVQRMEYDPGNRLLRTVDALGRAITCEYDVLGNCIVQRTAAGSADEQVTRFEYDAQGNLRSVVDGEGQRSSNDFDRVYNLVSTTDGNGHATRFAFDALNRQLEAVDALGQRTAWSYDAVGNRLTQTDALGRVTRFDYDADNRQVRMTAADGVVTAYAYDAVDNRIEVVRALGLPEQQRTLYQYDLENRLVAQTDALGHVTRTEYDANGNAVAQIDALGERWTYGYDANNRVVRITDALGAAVQYRYDGVGNRTQVIDALGHATTSYYNLGNEVVLTVNAEGEAAGMAYDGNGNLVAETRYGTRLAGVIDPAVLPAPAASAADRTARFAYDRANRQVRTLDPEGHLVQTHYDAVGNVVATRAYALQQALPPGGLAALVPNEDTRDRVTRFTYDAVNRRVSELDAEGYTTSWTYDAVGNRTLQVRHLSRTDLADPALQQRMAYRYDALDRVVEQTSPIGVRTAFVYDARGNRLSVTEAAGSADARTTSSVYDAADRLVSTTDALGTVTRYEMDAAGRVVADVRADGLAEARRSTYVYDAVGRRIEAHLADGSRVQQTYDAAGNLLTRTDAAGSAAARLVTYRYDQANRMVEQVIGAGTPAALSTRYTLNAFGEATRQAVADGTADARVMLNAYDHLGRLIARTDGNGIVTLADYDAFGNRIATHITGTTSSAGGSVITRTETTLFEYDGRDLLIAQRDAAGQRIERQYDGAGNLRFQLDGAGSAAARSTRFDYDLANRLTQKVVDPDGLALRTSFAYDARGNLVEQTDADGLASRTQFDLLDRAVLTTDAEGFSTSFVYNRFGNQVRVTTGQYLLHEGDAGYDATRAARAFPATTRLAYDAMDRKVLQADALGNVTRYEYDQRGNRSAQTEAFGTIAADLALEFANVVPLGAGEQRTSRYTFDAADRLVDEVQPAGTVVHTTYTAAGEQSTRTVDFGAGAAYRNATTRWFYDAGGRVAFQADPVGSVTRYEYDSFGNQVRMTRGLALDADGRPSSAATPDMRVTAYEYDAAHRITAEVVDPAGLALRTRYEYDARNNRVAVVDGNGHRADMAYDAADRLVWARDGAGHVTSFEYNGRGLRTAETRHASPGAGLPGGALPAPSAQDRRSTAVYDAAGRQVEGTDARGVVTRIGYDALGNRLSVVENATGLHGAAPRTTLYTYTLSNQVASQTDPSGLVSTYQYDAVYNLVEKRVTNRWLDTLAPDAGGQPTPREQTQVTRYTYDLNNRVTSEIVDATGLQLHTAWRYDSLGNRIAEVAANGFAVAESDSAWARQERRALGLVISSGNVLDAAQLSSAQRQAVLDAYTTRTWFDAAGRAVLTVDPNGHAKSVQYDAVGNVIRSTVHATPLDPVAVAALDGLQPPAVAAASGDRITDREYDKADRLGVERGAAARQFVGGQWVDGWRAESRNVYDAVGNVLRQIDGNGNVSYNYYDSANRLQGRIDAAGFLTLLSSDAFGNVLQERLLLQAPELSATQKEQLDLATYVPAGEQRVISHEYDAGDHRVRTLYPAAQLFEAGTAATVPLQVRRSYDAFSALLSETLMHRVDDAQPAATHYRYDAAGRLLAKIDPSADELVTSDAPQIVALRRDLGYVTAGGAGKTAAELSPAEVAALIERHTCHYAYDAVGNVREQIEGERITTFEYDAAHRTVRVHYPAIERVEVDAAGNVTVTAGYRPVALRSLDANGNLIAETRPDGERIDYRFDHANRQVVALNDGVYVAYGYNFAGDVTRIHRHFNAAAGLAAPPAADAARDQVIRIDVDALGRKTAERQLGNQADAADDRVVQYGYDANGNQVMTIDARGNASTVVYDGLNRMVGTVNREGGLTAMGYDAQGNVVSRQTGGFTAPSLRGQLRVDRVSDSGAVIEWSTDRAADGSVFVRVAGSGGAWQQFSASGGFSLDHRVTLSGLQPQTEYEYYIVSNDAFGYRLDSQGQLNVLRTAVGIGSVAVDGVRQVGERFQAGVHFSVPPGATDVRVRVGSGTTGATELEGVTEFAAVLQADGSYSALLDYAGADALFQVEWRDAEGVHRTGAAAIGQQLQTRRLDLTLNAEPQGANQQLTVSWNLADLLASGDIAFSQEPGEPPVYSVYVGLATSAGQQPLYLQTTLENGRFVARIDNLLEGPRILYLQYARNDGGVVDATPLELPALAGLDTRLQTLEFDFPDTDTAGATLSVRTRQAGSSTWTELPASAINGLSANLLGLQAGAYEFEATLQRAGQTLRQAGGSFTLREPASVAGLADAVNPGDVPFTLSDQAFSLPGLLPVGADETLSVTLVDEHGAAVPAGFAGGTLDLAVLTPGSYSLRVVKTRTTTTTSGDPPVTTVTTTTVNDISATLVVGPLTLADTQAQSLQGTRSLSAYALDAAHSRPVQVTTGGTSSADHSWNYFDANGWRIFSNEGGGVWTRYLHDSRGNVTQEVRFQRRDAAGAFVDRVADEATRPGLATLQADYEAALAAGSEHVRITTRGWSAAGHLLAETEHSTTHGAVSSRFAYDRFGNRTLQVSAEGLAGLENTVRSTYDAGNRVLRVETGPFEHHDEAGQRITAAAVQTFGYDGRGNKSTATDVRGYTVRMHYDAYNRLATQWDGQRAGVDSMLRTEHEYDAFDRLVTLRAVDLTGRAAHATQATRYTWSAFSQITSTTDALNRTQRREYDHGGNQVTEMDAAGHATRYAYSAENRVTGRTDRLGSTWLTEYDAYGQRIAETDANGRVTSYELGAFGQVLAVRTSFASGYASLGGAGSSTQTMRFDWLGRLAQEQDSFGKHRVYQYNDADDQIRIDDLALNQSADYGYDALGRRTSALFSIGGLVQRRQLLGYNSQGWLTSVTADAGYDAGGGAELNQRVELGYAFDAAGNRVRVLAENGDQGVYTYDAAGRMLQGRDDKAGTETDEVVNQLLYDGFGNRLSETRNGSTTTTYLYDAGNRVRSSSAGEQWDYDVMGNTTFQKSRDGATSTTSYNAENRSLTTTSVDKDGERTTSTSTYDAAGNVIRARVQGDNFRFDEVTARDVRYLEQSKVIANSWAKGAKGLEGRSSFTYDVNGNLAVVDRGRKKGAGENSVAVFQYDMEGQIIGRADKATTLTSANFFQGYAEDPDLLQQGDDYFLVRSETERVREQLFGGAGSVSSQLKSYLYVNNKSVAEAQGDQQISLRKLSLSLGGSGPLTLAAGDIVTDASGQVDRAATAHRIAALHYSGFSAMSADAQARVAAYVQAQLPGEVVAGAQVTLHAHILLADASYANVSQITDYSLRQIGADGLPGGSVQNHVVRSGDTLQSVAQMFFGSSSYWYLIADANGLSGGEMLTEGTTLSIPNRVANSANTADTFKVYNESEIIGTTSPEIRTIQKKKKWYQKLIMIVIVVIMIVAAVVTAGAALAATGALAAGTGGLLGVGAGIAGSIAGTLGVTLGTLSVATVGVAALAGAAIYAGANILTQGLSIAAGMQDKFDWKAVGKSAVQGAISGAAGAITGGMGKEFGWAQGSWQNVAARVSVEAGKQLALDGRITNVAGLVGAAASGGAFQGMGSLGNLASEYSRTFSAGLSLIESKVRGQGDSAMGWVNLATSAIFDSGVLQDADGYKMRDNLTAASGRLNWQYVAVHAIGAAVVASRMGEDAALSYIGNAIGSGIANDAYREMGRVTQRTLQLKTLEALIDSQPEKAEELKRLRERVLGGEENLTVELRDPGSQDLLVSGREANAVYRDGAIRLSRQLFDNATTPDGNARLLAAMSEEVGEWAAAKAGITFTNTDGLALDAGAIIGLQTMAALTSAAGAAGGPLMFSVDIQGMGSMDYYTHVTSLARATAEQFTPERLLANANDPTGAAQLSWSLSPGELRRRAVEVFGAGADEVITQVGVTLGVAKKGYDAVAGLGNLAGDMLGASAYLTLKLARAPDWLTARFEKSYNNMAAMVNATVKFFQDRSLGEAAYDIFVGPIAQGWNRTNEAYGRAQAIKQREQQENIAYSMDRAGAFLEYGMELGQFGVDVALGITSLIGVGVAAKALFNVGTAAGRAMAARFAAAGAGGSESIASRIGNLARQFVTDERGSLRFADDLDAPGAPGGTVANTAEDAGTAGARRRSARELYMGGTPSKYSRTGREVLERMRADELIQGEGPLLRGNPNNLRVRGPDGNWYLIDHTVDMAHTVDAVSWWNQTGRFFGPKAPEVRDFMLNPNHYRLEPQSFNRSAGASLGETYLPPAPRPTPGFDDLLD